MRGKLLAAAAVSSGLSVALTIGAGWIWLQVRDEPHWELRGSDPIIIEDQSRIHPSGEFARQIGGTVTFDQDTNCLLLMPPADVVIEDSRGEPVPHPIVASVVWPKGSRPVVTDGVRGVAVGAFLRRFGGDAILDRDTVRGAGQYVIATGHTNLLVHECATESGVIAVFTDPDTLSTTRASLSDS